jgi:hypothetical protein
MSKIVVPYTQNASIGRGLARAVRRPGLRRVAVVIAQAGVGACLKEHLQHRQVAVAGGDDQRRRPEHVLSVDVGARFEQRSCGVEMAVGGGPHQGRVDLCVLVVRIRASPSQAAFTSRSCRRCSRLTGRRQSAPSPEAAPGNPARGPRARAPPSAVRRFPPARAERPLAAPAAPARTRADDDRGDRR